MFYPPHACGHKDHSNHPGDTSWRDVQAAGSLTIRPESPEALKAYAASKLGKLGDADWRRENGLLPLPKKKKPALKVVGKK